jgi:hypothetical protein
VAANVEEGPTIAETILEAGKIVADAVKGAEPPDKARGNLLAESRCRSEPELYSDHCHTLPHGGHQLSWYFDDSSHGDGLTEWLNDVQ